MKHFINIVPVIFFVAIIFSSCAATMQTNQEEEHTINSMQCPVILVAKSPESIKDYGAITLMDANGNFAAFVCRNALSASINQSYQVGDTVKYCTRSNTSKNDR